MRKGLGVGIDGETLPEYLTAWEQASQCGWPPETSPTLVHLSYMDAAHLYLAGTVRKVTFSAPGVVRLPDHRLRS
jgi:hypothetical protein